MAFFNRKKDTEPVKELTAYVSGSVIPITEVNDPVFSSKSLGDGIAIRPEGQTITAPCSGEISMAADTGHAIGITVNNGAELLLHIGIEIRQSPDRSERVFCGLHSDRNEQRRFPESEILVRRDCGAKRNGCLYLLSG